jgi:two-component system NtrC family sensor kinase
MVDASAMLPAQPEIDSVTSGGRYIGMRPTWANQLAIPLKLIIAASIALPIFILSLTSWATFHDLHASIEDRTERMLDIVEEHGRKVLQFTDRLLQDADALLGKGQVPEAREQELHKALGDLQEALPEVQAIWAFDLDGRPIVSSTIFPVPRATLDNSDRDYFRAHVDERRGIYVGSNLRARIGDLTFFVVSRRRTGEVFSGVIALTLPPEGFTSFYEKIARDMNLSAGLFRSDGTPLARFPVPPGGLAVARTTDAFLEQIAASPDRGAYTVVSGLDGVRRHVVYRQIAPYGLYATAAHDEGAFWREWLSSFLIRNAVTLPLFASLIALSIIALRRSRALISEFDARQRAEAALAQSQKLEAIGQLTGGVAHDFNNLLMVVLGILDLLRKRLASDESMLRLIRNATQAAERGATLTQRMLAFARRQELRPEPVNVSALILDMEAFLRQTLGATVSITINAPPSAGHALVDQNQLELAILNLCVNARDAMPDGGTIEVSVRRVPSEEARAATIAGECLCITVSDTGHGMSEETLAKAHEPFFTTKGVGKGTGLGLSMVQGLAEQSGGRLIIESRVGEGTSATIWLPLAATGKPTETVESETPRTDEPAQVAVLVVDDDRIVLDSTAAMLEDLGHMVTKANSARDALRKLESSTFDLLLTDQMMPDMTGAELIRSVGGRWPHLRLVLASGYSVQDKVEGVVRLPKPFNQRRLATALRDAFAAKSDLSS